MDVCPNCFESDRLREYIESEGEDGDCPICGTKGTKIIDAGELGELFEPLSRYYQVAAPGEHYVYDSEDDCAIYGDGGETLDQLLQDEWPIFSDEVDFDDISKILVSVWPGYDDTANYVSGDLWYTSPDEDFQALAERLMHERRFFPKEHRPEPGLTSIDNLLEHRLGDYARKLDQAEWYRARRQENTTPHAIPDPLSADDMGAPPKERVLRGGRANSAGISYLYLSSTIETVIAEVRAIPGDFISVGTFAVPRNFMIIDLAAAVPPLDPFAYEDLRWELERRALLREFGRRLSQPVRDGEHELQYVATQYLAEFIASKDYAGIIYPSAMSKGVNLVLFDPQKATCTTVSQVKVETLEQVYTFREITDAERERAGDA